MFRRLPTGLPKDPEFPTNLKELGYFINDIDEIRSIEDPKAYFKFFLTKNDRHNSLQREAMNEVIREIIIERFEKLRLEKLLLPFGAQIYEPSTPIYVSREITISKRVIVLFYEQSQDLGVFAHRIIGGKGGINQGSAINLIKYIQAQHTSADHPEAPGIILANMGQLRWSRKHKKAITHASWLSLPQKSCVEVPFRMDMVKNTIPGNSSPAEHVDYIFNKVAEQMCDPNATFDIIGVSDGAVQVFEFLDDFVNFEKWSTRVNAFAALGTWMYAHDIRNDKFGRWLLNRGRAYALSDKPSGVYLLGPNGTKRRPGYGCPAFSLGEPYFAEAMLPMGYKTIIDWFQDVAVDPEYLNPAFRNITLNEEGKEFDAEDSDEEELEENHQGGEEWVPRSEEEIQREAERLKNVQLEDINNAAELKKVNAEIVAQGGKPIVMDNAVLGETSNMFAGITDILAKPSAAPVNSATNRFNLAEIKSAETQEIKPLIAAALGEATNTKIGIKNTILKPAKKAVGGAVGDGDKTKGVGQIRMDKGGRTGCEKTEALMMMPTDTIPEMFAKAAESGSQPVQDAVAAIVSRGEKATPVIDAKPVDENEVSHAGQEDVL